MNPVDPQRMSAMEARAAAEEAIAAQQATITDILNEMANIASEHIGGSEQAVKQINSSLKRKCNALTKQQATTVEDVLNCVVQTASGIVADSQARTNQLSQDIAGPVRQVPQQIAGSQNQSFDGRGATILSGPDPAIHHTPGDIPTPNFPPVILPPIGTLPPQTLPPQTLPPTTPPVVTTPPTTTPPVVNPPPDTCPPCPPTDSCPPDKIPPEIKPPKQTTTCQVGIPEDAKNVRVFIQPWLDPDTTIPGTESECGRKMIDDAWGQKEPAQRLVDALQYDNWLEAYFGDLIVSDVQYIPEEDMPYGWA